MESDPSREDLETSEEISEAVLVMTLKMKMRRYDGALGINLPELLLKARLTDQKQFREDFIFQVTVQH